MIIAKDVQTLNAVKDVNIAKIALNVKYVKNVWIVFAATYVIIAMGAKIAHAVHVWLNAKHVRSAMTVLSVITAIIAGPAVE